MTKSQRYSELGSFLNHYRRSGKFAVEIGSVHIRPNRWPGKQKTIKSRVALSHIDLARVHAACLSELDDIERKLRLGAEVRIDSTIVVPPVGEPSPMKFKNIKVRLRTLIERHGDRIPSGDEIVKTDIGLAKSLLRPNCTAFETGAHLHFTARSLVPFVVLLAIHSLFNPEVILTLEWKDVEYRTVFGEERLRLSPFKARANKRQGRTFAASASMKYSPVLLLETLKKYGEPVRRLIDPKFSDRVFVFWQVKGEPFSVRQAKLVRSNRCESGPGKV